MSTSPVSPEDIRAAAEVHEELGPEYRDAVVAAFVDKVEREVAARVAVRMAEARRAQAARRSRGLLVKTLALGAGAGALVAFTGITVAEHASGGSQGSSPTVHVGGQQQGGYMLLPYFPHKSILSRPPTPLGKP